MGKSQRQKGARGELEFAALLREHGFNARRHGRHFHGPKENLDGSTREGHDHCDVEHDVPGVHFEVKRQERVDVWSWYDQAVEGAKEGQIPVVAFRKNRRPFYVILSADHFLSLFHK